MSDGKTLHAFLASAARTPGKANATAGELAARLPSVGPETLNERVMHFWTEHPDQEALAVVEDGRPVGLRKPRWRSSRPTSGCAT